MPTAPTPTTKPTTASKPPLGKAATVIHAVTEHAGVRAARKIVDQLSQELQAAQGLADGLAGQKSDARFLKPGTEAELADIIARHEAAAHRATLLRAAITDAEQSAAGAVRIAREAAAAEIHERARPLQRDLVRRLVTAVREVHQSALALRQFSSDVHTALCGERSGLHEIALDSVFVNRLEGIVLAWADTADALLGKD